MSLVRLENKHLNQHISNVQPAQTSCAYKGEGRPYHPSNTHITFMTDLRCGSRGQRRVMIQGFHRDLFSNGKAKATHTAAILLDHGIALLRWIGALGEEHAFVSSGFFVFTHATGLFVVGRLDSCVFFFCLFVWREKW